MTLPPSLVLTWPQIFALLLVAVIGAFLAEWWVGNSPRFGILGSVVIGIAGSWLFANLPLDIAIEPRLEDMPVVRGVLGSLLLVATFAYFNKQRVRR